MTSQHDSKSPFATRVLGEQIDNLDLLPASYHLHELAGSPRRRIVADLSLNVGKFLKTKLRPATQLHLQVALGRNIVIADRIDLHLLWNGNGKIFVKPLSRFLLSSDFWQDYLSCVSLAKMSVRPAAESRSGFLYTYACLVSTESDFFIAIESRLLSRELDGSTITWTQWRSFVREIIETISRNDPDRIHPRFRRAELRLSRINAIHRTRNSFFRGNLAWIAAIAAYLVLILTAMQVGLATERLQGNPVFQQASYAFTLLAILGPVGMVSLVILRASIELTKDLWLIFKQEKKSRANPDEGS
ncbi:hypothetical protein V8C42DRAFT_360447 [Trichoderma barbatum]